MTAIKQGEKFWIVAWEGANSFSKGSKLHVVAILSARMSPKYVVQLTEELYALSLSLEPQMERSRTGTQLLGKPQTEMRACSLAAITRS